MSKLIALVTVAVMVDGKRQEFAPGSELPEINPHDAAELKRMNAVQDMAEEAAAEKAKAKEQAAANKAFKEARAGVLAAQVVTEQSPAPPDSATIGETIHDSATVTGVSGHPAPTGAGAWRLRVRRGTRWASTSNSAASSWRGKAWPRFWNRPRTSR